ncbi:ATPase [Nostoc sp. 3335mG]|nr:ATPase [Nostoc sp. 3335mG]
MVSTMRNPARLVPLAFLGAIAVGSVLLMLPFARTGPGGAPFLTALFTATSAACVTGLITVDTPTYWTGFGQTVILLLFQVGGFGIMTAATLLGLATGRRLRLSGRLIARAEHGSAELGNVGRLLSLIVVTTVAVEVVVALLLTLRLHFGYGEGWGSAAWHGVFHAVSAFNNAGFSTYSDSLIGFQLDVWVLAPIAFAIIVGALGFPVIEELCETPFRFSNWSLHTKLTVSGTIVLLVGGFLATLLAEWNNPATLGTMGVGGKLLNSAFHSVVTRTAGFNSIDVAALHEQTQAVTYLLMFIGGGSAGTAGGIKITTFLLLGVVVWSEIRGERDAMAFRRRIGTHVERQALTVVLLALALVSTGVMILLSVTPFALSDVIFEVISAFATVGLSTGITGQLPASAQAVLIVLMFVGRVGTITVATALALGVRRRTYRYPEERPIIG